jgi:RNA polymerase sporulation-specific sigma factor
LPVSGFLATFLMKILSYLASYVSTPNVFPKPLSSEEEERLLKLKAQGDQNARNILIEHNLRLVAHVVKKFDQTGESMDDLISIGTIGLIKAINTFQTDKNTRLATYAARCIENEILMHLRATKRQKSEIMLYEPIGTDKEDNDLTLMDILTTNEEGPTEHVENKLEYEKLYRKLVLLSAREQQVLKLRYGLLDGIRKTQREISKLLGISRSYVSRIEKRALGKLQKEMEK